jgi:hypothetical protein
MTKRIHRYLIVVLALVCTATASANWIEDSDKITLRVLAAQAVFQPESAAAWGLSDFDSDIIDLNTGYVQRRLEANEAQLHILRAELKRATDPRLQQDLAILQEALAQDSETLALEQAALLPYFNLHQLYFYSFRSLLDPRNEASRYPAALKRLRKYAGLAQGYEPLVELAMARSSERFEQGLLGPYIRELEANIDNAPRYVAGMKQLFAGSGLDGWASDFALLEQQLDAYLEWQQRELLPRARQDNRLPAAIYANKLRGYGISAEPEELVEKAQYSYQLLRSEMKALARQIAAERGWKKQDLQSVIAALKAEQLPPEEVLPTYRERLREIEAIIEREKLVTLPEREANIRLATEAESAAVPASFMSPPQLINNTGQYGEFVLVQSNPALGPEAKMDDFSHEAMTWALTVHEARPGHELQFASLVENGTSLARAVYAANSANIEGWGLYAESIMHQYLPLEGQLFNLYTRIMRAARMFLDPLVNTGQLYYWGYMSLLRLRTEVELALGEDFDQLAFHDFILEQGLLPPELLREAVLEEFVR